MNENISYVQFQLKTFDVSNYSSYIHTSEFEETAIIHRSFHSNVSW